jgi:hypothetical protein
MVSRYGRGQGETPEWGTFWKTGKWNRGLGTPHSYPVDILNLAPHTINNLIFF